MESAIMFESGADRYVDNVVVVTAPEEVRIERIMKRDGISREKAQEWMQRQWPQEKVRQLAQYEIINDGRQDLDSQIADLLQKLSNTRNTHQLL
jgi:dephospho-CoA kinase